MEENKFKRLPVIIALFNTVLIFIFMGCGNPIESDIKPVITSVAVASNPDHGVVVAGRPGVLNYNITIVGENIFPFDLLGANVVLGFLTGGNIVPIPGITVCNDTSQTIGASGDSYPLRISVNIPDAAAYFLTLELQGVRSNPFNLNVGYAPGVAAGIAVLRNMETRPWEFPIAAETGDELLVPQNLYFDGDDITIIIRGKPGDTLTLDGIGSMFTVSEGVTLVLENIELRGVNNNDSALVFVDIGGGLTMNVGAIITGNTNLNSGFIDDMGGGINNQGTFNMNGGSITGNAATFGGGVLILYPGILVMYDGEITDNTASLFGGGVVNMFNGFFSMHGGYITNNTAPDGGGVMVSDYGEFIMLNGRISGNTANAAGMTSFGEGGGVLVIGSVLGEENYAFFEMFAGTISGNNAVYGGGVANIDFGLFDMINGEISGNTVALFGGGVANLESSLFIMRDGEISGNISGHGGGVSNFEDGMFVMQDGVISGNSASYYGGGVENFEGTFLISNGIIYGHNVSSDLANTVMLSQGGAALYSEFFMSSSIRGTFGLEGFEPIADLSTTDLTLHVVNGFLPGSVSSVTITDLPAKYVNIGREVEMDLWAFNNDIDFYSLGIMVPVTSDSVRFIPGSPMDAGSWTLVMEIFFSPWVINQVPEAVYEIVLDLTFEAMSISYNDPGWVQVHPSGLTGNIIPFTFKQSNGRTFARDRLELPGRPELTETQRLPNRRLPPEERVLRDRASEQRMIPDRQLRQLQPRLRQSLR